MKRLVAILVCCFAFSAAFAQKDSAGTVKKFNNKFKPPKLVTIWGGIKDSVGIPPEELLALLEKPLNVSDGKEQYPINSYVVFYKQQTVTEDEDGNVRPVIDTHSERFFKYPISDVWKNSLAEKLGRGDELQLLEIIVKDKQGRPMYAPPVKITVL